MQCAECGKPPHGGYCYPIFDMWLIAVVVSIAVFVGIIVALLLVL